MTHDELSGTTCCKHPAAAMINRVNLQLASTIFLQIGNQPPDALLDTASLHWKHLRKEPLDAFGVLRLRWLFPTFVRTSLPLPVMRKRFEVPLWVFSLYFPSFILRGTVITPLIQNSAVLGIERTRTRPRPRMCYHPILAQTPGRLSYFFAFVGASTISTLRPSIAGGCSITLKSDSSSATSFRSCKAKLT
jgi:hypothetical protein